MQAEESPAVCDPANHFPTCRPLVQAQKLSAAAPTAAAAAVLPLRPPAAPADDATTAASLDAASVTSNSPTSRTVWYCDQSERLGWAGPADTMGRAPPAAPPGDMTPDMDPRVPAAAGGGVPAAAAVTLAAVAVAREAATSVAVGKCRVSASSTEGQAAAYTPLTAATTLAVITPPPSEDEAPPGLPPSYENEGRRDALLEALPLSTPVGDAMPCVAAPLFGPLVALPPGPVLDASRAER